ncbi:hypothetical protein AAFF_G00244420 [Aldrovandia affinis]|uniref:Tectonic-2 n=1 Tax=Aldrovandia affinis TaxID=143900 RepID=A0AAD7RDP5_9TELE|nr:hypothetical protein AAFF_G00244420 [Aldrovandia affinis]
MAAVFSPRCACFVYTCVCITLICFMKVAHCNVVFQPAFVFASGPRVTAFLQGNISDISLTLRSVLPSNTTGRLPPPSCAEEDPGQWILTPQKVGKSVVRVELSLNRSLQLCGNETDCCLEPLCVQETLQVTACLGDIPLATLLVQAQVYAVVLPTGPVSDNVTAIPNQAFEPLGPCPCDLTTGSCDVRCCCDQDCSQDALQLFETQCFPGVFGGNVTPTPDYQCSVQSSNNAPDWFPFLCVTSPPENSPFLGLFYQGETVTPKRSASFQAPVPTAPLPTADYRQGDPIFTDNDQYFTVPQRSLVGQCLGNAPMGFLQNFQTQCVTHLKSCPTGPPLLTSASELSVGVRDGLGGVVTVTVLEERAGDLRRFVSVPIRVRRGAPHSPPLQVSQERAMSRPSPNSHSKEHCARRFPVQDLVDSRFAEPLPAAQQQLCENVTLGLSYTFSWMGNGITNISLVQTVADVALDPSVSLTTWFSAKFVNGNATAQSISGNPGYQIGLPVIGGLAHAADNDSGSIQRLPISLWRPVGAGLCISADTRPVPFGENATAGCLLPLSLQDFAQCSWLRENVQNTLAALVNSTHVARNGNPDYYNLADWVDITYVPLNASSPPVDLPGTCVGVPFHQNIHITSAVVGLQGGLPQREIQAVDVRVDCGGGDPAPCLNSTVTQSFLISSSVTFIDIPAQTGPPKTRFQIHFSEYDCDRNDVCWPQLAYPLTRYYTGEPYSQSLAKGLILVYFFIAASVLGTPWRQIRQAWNSAAL